MKTPKPKSATLNRIIDNLRADAAFARADLLAAGDEVRETMPELALRLHNSVSNLQQSQRELIGIL